MNNSKLTTHSSQLAALVTEVLAANKYRHLDPGLVQHVGAQVLRSTPQLKAAVKETKSRLHQSAAAYIRTTPHYDSWPVSYTHLDVYKRQIQNICLTYTRNRATLHRVNNGRAI